MINLIVKFTLAAFVATIMATGFAPAPLSNTPVFADFGDPCSKYKKGSRKWKKCKKKTSLLEEPKSITTEDEKFFAGYWLAKNGRYLEAINVLTQVKDKNDPRVLNYIGFATRKLGNVDKALIYYKRAISLDPDYVMSRAYMGEAYLAKGDRVAARDQLREIANRCGTSCEAYAKLKGAIAGTSTL